MKKTTSRSSSKKPAAKSRLAHSSKVTKAKKPRRTAVAAKKTTAKKGLKHHAKRLYHLTPKFVHGMIAGAFVGVVLVASLGISGGVHADQPGNPPADACIKTQDGITVNNKNANVFVRLDGACGKHTLQLKSYYAPSATGQPHNQQVLYQVSSPAVVKSGGSNDWVKISVGMPDVGCFYQVDLVDISNPAGSEGNPMVVSKTGGNHDCTPNQTHSYACTSFGLTPGDNRTVTISTFSVTNSPNVTFTGASVNWGDGQVQNATTAQGLTHQYAADNTYNVSAVTHFSFSGQFGDIHNVDAPACGAPVTFTTLPNVKNIPVCEIATQRTLSIPETLYGTDQYPTDKYTTDLSQCVVTPPTTPPATLANTGPGAVITVFGLALLGGYAFHMRHRHVQRKRAHHRA